jgi:hypothetical protein
MSQSITIQEGGKPKPMSGVRKLRTKSGSGTVDWVPESETMVKDLYVVENGEYVAANEGAYAYYRVSVNVAGGESGKDGDEILHPDLETGDTYDFSDMDSGDVDYGDWDMDYDPDYAPIGSQVTGYEDDGNEWMWTVDDGMLEHEKVPSSIVVDTPPTDTEYVDGQSIDFTGLVVKAYDGNGELFVSDTTPQGIVPIGSLTFPVTTASLDAATGGTVDGTGTSYVDALLPFGFGFSITDAPTYSYMWRAPSGSEDAIRSINRMYVSQAVHAACMYFEHRDTSTSGHGCVSMVLASETPFQYGDNGQHSASEYTKDGKTVYWGGTTSNTVFLYDVESNVPTNELTAFVSSLSGEGGIIAWSMVYNASRTAGQQVPVQWRRADGKTLEDSFAIQVERAEAGGGGGGGGAF